MNKKILLRYGELTLKGKNRDTFIKKLHDNLAQKMTGEVITTFDRGYLEYSEENIENLKYIFGLSSYSIIYEVQAEMEAIENQILELIKDKEFKTFRVDTKRSNKNFPLTSSEMNQKMGGFILSKFENKQVIMKNPDLVVYLEIRNDKCFVFTDVIYTRGGMPVGITGKTLHLISGGIDSPVAANLMQKRGLVVDYLNFITPPHTDDMTTKKIEDIVKLLTKYQTKSTLFQVNYTKIMNYLALTSSQRYKITLMRRSFYRIAQKLAEKYHYLALSNGENIAQVASQTLESINVIQQVTNLPIFRPVLCYDKIETIRIAEEIGTLEISNVKACETCELFAPKDPVTKPKLDDVMKAEFDLQRLLELEQEAVDNVQIFKFENK
ncbi:tRNA uracil 4-sulfurtransferase ThiI [[Mycoplasma] gypis]|uniref:Probable tRNA sulfurtransferase n=1 Tax=[Mycoplasma] gypis TaxID=92404 RepID=A0ABZ2RN61_9BACT|nr:tRNA uracil 4-sulfurtransferase ThiI [[Mycoplasma] gypis]MBN0919633.1 tRNA 4-thiouridine(8) synthase ThiI [[Mycoplasma] gypis]